VKGISLQDICRGVRGQVDLAPAVRQFIELTLATVDNPQFTYLITPHWGSRALSRVIINNNDVGAVSLSPLFSGEGISNRPLVLNFNKSLIGRRGDYARALRGGYDSVVYVGNGDYTNAQLLVGDLTVKARGLPTEIPVFYTKAGVSGLGIRYSVDFTLRNELYYDLVITREGDLPYLVVMGFNISPLFLGIDNCRLVDVLVNTAKAIASPDLRLNYVIHVAVNDEWGNPRFPPLYWGFSTVNFIEGTLPKLSTDLTPLVYIYIDSVGDYVDVKAPEEVRGALNEDLGSLTFMESPGILPDNYGYWPILIKRSEPGTPGITPDVGELLRRVLSKLETDPQWFMNRVSELFARDVEQAFSAGGIGELARRINPDNASTIKGTLIKYVYSRMRDTISRVNLLNLTGAEPMVNITTGEVYLDAPGDAAEAELMNLRLSILDKVRALLVK
jgi:hypothetical protein